MHEPFSPHLERSPTLTSLAPQTAGLGAAPDRHGPGCQRGRGQSVDEAWPRGGAGSPPPPPTSRCPSTTDRRPTRPFADPAAAKPRSLWLPRGALDARTHCRRHSFGIWHLVSSAPCRPLV